MKRYAIFALAFLLVGSTAFLTACRTTKKGGDTNAGRGGPGSDEDLNQRVDLSRSRMERGKFESVLFAYDSAVINPHEGPKLDTVVNFLKADGAVVVLVEGHCDERGTAEYNRALGERRALAAREALVARGADAARIQTISYGKDKPADPGHTDAAFSKNRRAEFVVVRP